MVYDDEEKKDDSNSDVNSNSDLSSLAGMFGRLQIAEVSKAESEKARECTVCLSKFAEHAEVITLPCFHRYVIVHSVYGWIGDYNEILWINRFHKDCMLSWNKGTCPVCRHPINQVQ